MLHCNIKLVWQHGPCFTISRPCNFSNLIRSENSGIAAGTARIARSERNCAQPAARSVLIAPHAWRDISTLVSLASNPCAQDSFF